MEYKMEELMPVMAKLSDKYTSKESSSISYVTAQKLMDAILYCIQEQGWDGENMLEGAKPKCMDAYEAGYKAVLHKVMQAKESYHRIISDFDDFGCRNYRDTILKGIPEFFLRYDAKFEPQNHLLTIDYPALVLADKSTGVDYILKYLEEVEYEQHFLKYFARNGIVNLLEFACPGYKELFFDNIGAAVLMRAAACLAVDRNVYHLELMGEDYEIARDYLKDKEPAQAERHMSVFLDILEKKIMKEAYRGIYKSCAHDFTVRIGNGMFF